jgi:hypothetical protein
MFERNESDKVERPARLSVDAAVDSLLSGPSTEDNPDEDETVEDLELDDAGSISESPDSEDGDLENLARQSEDGGESDDEEIDREESEDDEEVLFQVNTPDGPVQVSQDELLNGYLRQQDYTRKTQDLANRRREIDEYRVAREQYLQAIEVIGEKFKDESLSPELLESDPQEYIRRKEKLELLNEEKSRVLQERQREYAERMQEATARGAQALRSAVPEWSDNKVMSKDIQKIRSYANRQGFNEQEVSQVYDPRVVLVLRKAMMHDEKANVGKKVIGKKIKNKPRVVTSGSKKRVTSGKVSSQYKQAVENFNQAGRGRSKIEAGVDLLLASRKRG